MVVDKPVAMKSDSASLPATSIGDAEVMVSVRNVSKMYRIYDKPQDRLKQMFWRGRRTYGREFWALHDISFEMRKGDTLGIIGRNGSGKSTLLQIIAGTLTPTTGNVTVNGRVAALLELGSGFNPEFTGRENVFLNGAILGISREEMQQRFDDIVAFADIGQFLEQPVKTYSSGMMVRLAFAVQASIEPDILIVDEALAVGDVFFRQKCFRRLEELRERGVSILVVSHAMMDIEQFCKRAILLNAGTELFQGSSSEAVKRYYLLNQQDRLPALLPHRRKKNPEQTTLLINQSRAFTPPQEAFIDISGLEQVSNGWARCTGVAICNVQGEPCRSFEQGEQASFYYEFEALQDIEIPIGGLILRNDHDVIAHGKNTLEYGSEVPTWVTQGSRIQFQQDIALELATGEYSFEVGLATINRYDYEQKGELTHAALSTKIIRLCHIPDTGHIIITARQHAQPVQLLHHGIANLPGKCRVSVNNFPEDTLSE